jgi:hypothetical protein
MVEFLNFISHNLLLVGAIICLLLIILIVIFFPANKEVSINKEESKYENEYVYEPTISIDEPAINNENFDEAIEKDNIVKFEEPIHFIEEDFKETEQKNEIEELLSLMEKDLNKEKEKSISAYEKEEEEDAIISYQELVRASNENRLRVYDEEKEEYVEPNLKFKPSEVISPIYGIKKEKEEIEIIEEDEEFLQSIIDFKNNL